MFAFKEQKRYLPTILPNTENSPAVSFRFSGIRTLRPKSMYIDMNAGKGCHSCGSKAL